MLYYYKHGVCLLVLVEQQILADSETVIKVQKFDAVENDPFILVIVTPLMKRVHEKVCYFHLSFYLHVF